MSELLDFNSRDDFEFLRIAPAYKIPEGQQAKLRKDCELVVHSAQKSVLELCRVGLFLKEIKEDGTWRFVYNEKSGTTFQYQKFTDFTSYVFGLSPTMVENLMTVSQFAMTTNDGNDDVVFINEKYERYKMSQLVELGSVQTWDRDKFTPEMTVSEMRLCKSYIKSGNYLSDRSKSVSENKNFDLLSSAKAWEEEKKAPKKDTAPNVLPGQMSLSEMFAEEEKNPTSDFAEECEYEYEDEDIMPLMPAPDSFYEPCEPKEGETWQGGGLDSDDVSEYEEDVMPLMPATRFFCEQRTEPGNFRDIAQPIVIDTDDYDEESEAQEDMQAEMLTIEEESDKWVEQSEEEKNPTSDLAEDCTKKEYEIYMLVKGATPGLSPDFKNREGIREFYRNFRDWEQIYCNVPFMEVYRYKFKIGTLYAVSARIACICHLPAEREYKFSVRYFWQDKDGGLVFETNKFDLERFIPAYKDEL